MKDDNGPPEGMALRANLIEKRRLVLVLVAR
jgi:hypothetical protein